MSETKILRRTVEIDLTPIDYREDPNTCQSCDTPNKFAARGNMLATADDQLVFICPNCGRVWQVLNIFRFIMFQNRIQPIRNIGRA